MVEDRERAAGRWSVVAGASSIAYFVGMAAMPLTPSLAGSQALMWVGVGTVACAVAAGVAVLRVEAALSGEGRRA